MSIMDIIDPNGENNVVENQEKMSQQVVEADTAQIAPPEETPKDGSEENSDKTSTTSLEPEEQALLLKRTMHHVKLPFPWKVQEMLAHVEKEGKNDIVSWLPHGKSFRVHKENEFVSSIMSSYFNQSKFTSFTRQLYIYGFQKIQDGPDKGAFFHKHFVKSNKSLCLSMSRKKEKPMPKQPDPTSVSAFLRGNQGLAAMAGPDGQHCFPPHTLGGNTALFFPEVNPSQSGTGLQLFQPATSNSMSMPSSNCLGRLLAMNQSSCLSGLSEIQSQPAEEGEEDWLSKYERLTAQTISPIENERTMLSNGRVGSPHLDNLNSEIVPTSWMGQRGISPFVNSDPSTSTNMHLMQRSVLSSTYPVGTERMSLGHMNDEKIHPRLLSSRRNAAENPPYVRSLAEPSKESDSFSEGDEVDFEGMKFHFVDR